ncbi:Probable LRR receptor-like serine/threonine-protein kinase At3g47570 [Linum perenne]
MVGTALLVQLLCLCCCASSSGVSLSNETDRLALLNFKSLISGDPFGILSSWNDSIHLCEWYGVSCSERHHGRVTALNLSSNELYGSISPHVGNLSFLKFLRLYNNNFIGEIPPEIGRLRKLERLLIQNNSLGGAIPSNISGCFALTHFFVHNNKLAGGLPWLFGVLNKLQLFVGNHLQGIIPSSLSALRGIQWLDLSSNNLSGPIPKFLESMNITSLLNLSHNNFDGEVPTHKLCGGIASLQLPPCNFTRHSKKTLSLKWKIVISTISSLLFLTFVGSCCFILLIKQRRIQDKNSTDDPKLLQLSYQRLFEATNGFSLGNQIGVGSFGSVYKGVLNDIGEASINNIAVKVFNLQRRGAFKSFMAECEANNCGTPIVHCDLKPSNVLLDEDMVAHVGDFGLARFLSTKYGMGNDVSIQGDIYSYGILLLELFTGKRPTDETFRDGLSLHNVVKSALSKQNTSEVVDPVLLNELLHRLTTHRNYTTSSSDEARKDLQEVMSSILEIGITCSSNIPEKRIDMSEVLSRLAAIKSSLFGRR